MAIFSQMRQNPLLFIIYTRATDYMDQKNRQIFISQTQIALLEETFRKTWNRSPNKDELSAQTENLVKDEVFSKTAVDMGVDKTDPAIKRRLRQIMEMMMDDYATIYPAENQLRHRQRNLENLQHRNPGYTKVVLKSRNKLHKHD